MGSYQTVPLVAMFTTSHHSPQLVHQTTGDVWIKTTTPVSLDPHIALYNYSKWCIYKTNSLFHANNTGDVSDGLIDINFKDGSVGAAPTLLDGDIWIETIPQLVSKLVT